MSWDQGEILGTTLTLHKKRFRKGAIRFVLSAMVQAVRSIQIVSGI